MHTSEVLTSDDFVFSRDGAPLSLTEVIPDLTTLDRVGVVTRQPTDGAGASNLILACVTAFYDLYRATGEDFFTYPDYFTFQPGKPIANYGSLDIWPPHKNVPVSGDPEQMLQAINDRGITILLVPDGPHNGYAFDRISLSSAQRRIRHCFLYAADGRLQRTDFTIRRPRQPTLKYQHSIFASLADEAVREPLLKAWEQAQNDPDQIEEGYRSITLEEALALLPLAWA